MTIERRRRLRRSTAATRRVARHDERSCDHLHDTASRYDHAAKRLELLLTCPVCETEKVIHSLAYEPRFEPAVASVHALHAREGASVDALDRAA
jgi:ribosomal protein L44E